MGQLFRFKIKRARYGPGRERFDISWTAAWVCGKMQTGRTGSVSTKNAIAQTNIDRPAGRTDERFESSPASLSDWP